MDLNSKGLISWFTQNPVAANLVMVFVFLQDLSGCSLPGGFQHDQAHRRREPSFEVAMCSNN